VGFVSRGGPIASHVVAIHAPVDDAPGLASHASGAHQVSAHDSDAGGTAASQEGVENRLADLLERVIDWLKFAETKNTGAVGLSSAAVGVVVSFALFGPPLPLVVGIGLGIGAVCMILSLLFSVASFLPSTNLEKHLAGEREKPGSRDNLLFYGHLARYEPRGLVQAVAEHYFGFAGEAYTPSKFALDLAAQAITNARITVRKLVFFRYSIIMFGIGVLVSAIAMAVGATLSRLAI
jgi:hypothetical protein